MLSNLLNTILLAGFSISAVYGIVTVIRKKNVKTIFYITLISISAFLISRLFFIVLNLSGGNANGFSVGVLGQVAGYLFLALANQTYLPFEANKHRFCLKAAPVLLFPLVCYSYSFIIFKTAGEIVSSVFYMCSTCLALYFSFRNIVLAKTDSNYKNLKPFFLCAMTISAASTLESAVFAVNNELIFSVICVLSTIVVFADSVIILPLLNKGVEKDA